MNAGRIALLLCSLLSVACSPPATPKSEKDSSLDAYFGRGELVIVDDHGQRREFDVYLATDFDQHRRGLMFVRSLPETTGMLFVYETDEIHSMWMKNTYIPLDMIFVRANGDVSSVIHDATPLTLETRAASEPVRYVLELNGGAARRFNIGTGSRLLLDESDLERDER